MSNEDAPMEQQVGMRLPAIIIICAPVLCAEKRSGDEYR